MINLFIIQAVVLDMDGVLWRGEQVLEGAPIFLDWLRQREIPFALASNNGSRTPDDYVAKLERLGLGAVARRFIVNSGMVTVDYLKARYPTGTQVHVLGGAGLKTMIAEGGYEVVDDVPAVPVVVAGIDHDLTYTKAKRAATFIRNGAVFIGTNDDATFPSADGLSPGAGSILALLSVASGRQPIVMGKPNAPMYEAALHVLGTTAAHTLMIGDRLNTDVAGAQAVGMPTALVLTGISTRDDVAREGITPDVVVDNLGVLLKMWEEDERRS